MSGILYAQAGRPSTPSTPTQSPLPSNVPNPTPASPSPANTPTSSDTPPSADTNNPQTANFADTTLGKAALGTAAAATSLAAIGVGIKYGLKKKKVAEKTTQGDYSSSENHFFPAFSFEEFNPPPQSAPKSPQETKEKAYEILDQQKFNAAVKKLSETTESIKFTDSEADQAYKTALDKALEHLKNVTNHEQPHEELANSLKFLHDNSIVAHGHEHYQALKALHEHYEGLRALQ